MKNLYPVHVTATTLPDAWFQSIFKCLELGRDFLIDRGSFEGQARLEFDWITIHIKFPANLPLIPKLRPGLGIDDPVAPDYIDHYLPYLMTAEEAEGEAYTYGQRIVSAKLPKDLPNSDLLIPEFFELFNTTECIEPLTKKDIYPAFLNQMELMIWTYKNKGYRNNQMIMQVGQGSDMMLKDPPCLRHIDTRIQDGKLHFFPYFRSWDLWGGFPANLAAIELMKQYCAEQIGVGNGEIIASSKGLHIYKYVWELAELVRGKTIQEFRQECGLGFGQSLGM